MKFYCNKNLNSWGLGIHYSGMRDILGKYAGWFDIQILCVFIGFHWGFREFKLFSENMSIVYEKNTKKS